MHSRSSSSSATTYHSSNQDDYQATYQKRASSLIRLVNQLRDLGAQAELSLPTIVVCGNQSVGKSSIIEAVCQIPLPRQEGTCTRCVIEIRLVSGDQDWSCKVKLRKEFDKYGRPLPSVVESLFQTVEQPKKLDDVIRSAQKVLLNPSTDPSKLKADQKDELLFTGNVVCLDITGADIDLTLIDLPGIIQSVGPHEDSRVIGMIESIVKSYISKERAIVLAVISCKDEIENQVIYHLCREVDPLGSRTIGIVS